MFDGIKNFLLEHWEAFFLVALSVFSFVLALVRKKPVLNKVAIYLNELFQRIPIYIEMVEKDGHGTEKKNLVLALCKEFLATQFGYYDFDILEKTISDYIEDVLNTPQKKKED